jgi:sodium transport system permease protein
MRDIGLLYLRELRCALRERNIVVNSILLPIFLYPLLLWLVYTAISFVMGQTEGFVSRVTLQNPPAAQAALQKELERDPQIQLISSQDPASDLREGRLDLLIEFLPPQDGPAIAGNFRARLMFDDSKDRSSTARTRITGKLRRYRDDLLDQEAQMRGLSRQEFQRYWIEDKNVATGRQMGQFILGLMLPLFMVIMLAIGSFYPAVDCTAGEREKSTWETLMTTATPRANIVIAKYLYVATMSSLAGILNLTAMMLSMKSVMAPILGNQGDSFAFQIPLASILLMLVVTIPLAMFISAGMMILASFARTFKEGQAMVSPFYIATFMPVLFLQVPGLELTSKLALIPIVNVVMVFREAISGIYRWPQIGITLGVEAACVALALWLATTILKYEDFILGSYGGNFGKFIKERLFGRRQPRRFES